MSFTRRNSSLEDEDAEPVRWTGFPRSFLGQETSSDSTSSEETVASPSTSTPQTPFHPYRRSNPDHPSHRTPGCSTNSTKPPKISPHSKNGSSFKQRVGTNNAKTPVQSHNVKRTSEPQTQKFRRRRVLVSESSSESDSGDRGGGWLSRALQESDSDEKKEEEPEPLYRSDKRKKPISETKPKKTDLTQKRHEKIRALQEEKKKYKFAQYKHSRALHGMKKKEKEVIDVPDDVIDVTEDVFEVTEDVIDVPDDETDQSEESSIEEVEEEERFINISRWKRVPRVDVEVLEPPNSKESGDRENTDDVSVVISTDEEDVLQTPKQRIRKTPNSNRLNLLRHINLRKTEGFEIKTEKEPHSSTPCVAPKFARQVLEQLDELRERVERNEGDIEQIQKQQDAAHRTAGFYFDVTPATEAAQRLHQFRETILQSDIDESSSDVNQAKDDLNKRQADAGTQTEDPVDCSNVGTFAEKRTKASDISKTDLISDIRSLKSHQNMSTNTNYDTDSGSDCCVIDPIKPEKPVIDLNESSNEDSTVNHDCKKAFENVSDKHTDKDYPSIPGVSYWDIKAEALADIERMKMEASVLGMKTDLQ